MARCSTEEISNSDAAKETATLTKQAIIVYWPPVRRPGH
jgi:hypothetical protein